MSTEIATTVTLSHEMIKGVSLVGQLCTLPPFPNQYKIHSVEGSSWYAHEADDGTIMLDADMPHADWITEPIVMIIPVGHKIGEGFGQTLGASHIRRGVSLTKAYA